MTCRDVDGMLISKRPRAAIPPEMSAHIAGCDRCRRLIQALEHAPEAAPPPDRIGRIQSAILADLKPVKPLPSAGVLWVAFLLAVAVVAAIGTSVLGTAGWHALSTPQRVAIFATLAASAALLALSSGRQIVPGSMLRMGPPVLVIAVLAVVTGICAIAFRPHAEPTFVATGLVCLRIGLECAVAAAVLVWLVLRRGAILTPMLTGATAGALAGLSGLTVLEMFCPNLNRNHILAWHLGAVLASVLGGVAIGIIAEYSGSWRARRSH